MYNPYHDRSTALFCQTEETLIRSGRPISTPVHPSRSQKKITSTNLSSSFTIRLQCKNAELVVDLQRPDRRDFLGVIWASVPISSSALVSSQAERGLVVVAPCLTLPLELAPSHSPPLLPSPPLAVIFPASRGPCLLPTPRARWPPPLQRNAPGELPPFSSE